MKRDPAPLLVATRTFAVDIDGRRETITAGVSRVIRGHELTRRFPDAFAACGGSAAKAAKTAAPRKATNASEPQRSAGTADKGWRLPELSRRLASDVELRTGAPAGEVVIGRDARRTILEHAVRARDGREVGGLLLGPQSYSWNELQVIDVTDELAGATRKSRSLRFDHGSILAAELAYRAQTDGLWARRGVHLGIWHTHPTTARDGGDRPSPHDLACFDGFADILGASRYVGLILTPDGPDGWVKPELHAWVLRRRDGLPSICEPAAVVTRG